MLTELNTKLLTLFQTLKWTNKPFVEVYDYHTLENTGYPYLTFEPVEFSAEILDNCNNMRTFWFDVIIFQEVTETGWRKKAKDIISKCLDDVIDLIDTNYTLALTDVKMVVPVAGRIEPFTLQNWKALVWTLRLNVQTYNFIN